MKKILEKNKKTLVIFGLFLLAAIGMTVAYYNSMKDFKNEFSTSKPGVAIHEIFDPTDYWVPGEEKSKKVWFSNSGEMDMLLRFKVDIAWADETAHPDNPPQNFVTLYWKASKDTEGKKRVPVKLDEADKANENENENFDFVLGPDGYYYYNKVLKAEDSDMSLTQNVLESVKFSENLSNDGHKNSDYSNVQVNVTIQGETVLASAGGQAAVDEWGKEEKGAVSAVTIGENDQVTWTFGEND